MFFLRPSARKQVGSFSFGAGSLRALLRQLRDDNRTIMLHKWFRGFLSSLLNIIRRIAWFASLPLSSIHPTALTPTFFGLQTNHKQKDREPSGTPLACGVH